MDRRFSPKESTNRTEPIRTIRLARIVDVVIVGRHRGVGSAVAPDRGDRSAGRVRGGDKIDLIGGQHREAVGVVRNSREGAEHINTRVGRGEQRPILLRGENIGQATIGLDEEGAESGRRGIGPEVGALRHRKLERPDRRAPRDIPAQTKYRRGGGNVVHQPVLHPPRLRRLKVVRIRAQGERGQVCAVKILDGAGRQGDVDRALPQWQRRHHAETDDRRGNQRRADGCRHQQFHESESLTLWLLRSFHLRVERRVHPSARKYARSNPADRRLRRLRRWL